MGMGTRLARQASGATFHGRDEGTTMNDLPQLMTDTLATGAVAGVVTTAAAALEGQAADGSAAGPINAVSHILWGDKAAAQDGVSAKYTLNGLALNLAAVTSWAAVQEVCFGRLAA